MPDKRSDVDALAALLAAERRLILEGRYGQLEALQDDKDRLAARLGTAEASAALARLHDLAGSNLALLSAAREGLAAAHARLRELARLERGETGYDRHGTRADGTAGPRTSRRV